MTCPPAPKAPGLTFDGWLMSDAMSNSAPGYVSGLAVVERTGAPDSARPGEAPPSFAVRHLVRFPPGTGYPELVASLARTFAGPPLAGSTLVVDRTGVGRPVVDLLRQADIGAVILPVTITAGQQATPAPGGGRNVPKRELVSSLLVLFQSRRVRIARALPEAPLLAKELEGFKVRLTAAANETFGADTAGQHDDLVIALALACWVGENALADIGDCAREEARSLVSRAPEGVFEPDVPAW
jgi:hypothetical protein